MDTGCPNKHLHYFYTAIDIVVNQYFVVFFELKLFSILSSSRKYPYSPHRSFFFCFAPPPQQEIPVKLYTLLLKFWLLRPPSSHEFSMTFHCVGMDFFWNYTLCETNCHWNAERKPVVWNSNTRYLRPLNSPNRTHLFWIPMNVQKFSTNLHQSDLSLFTPL